MPNIGPKLIKPTPTKEKGQRFDVKNAKTHEFLQSEKVKVVRMKV